MSATFFRRGKEDAISMKRYGVEDYYDAGDKGDFPGVLSFEGEVLADSERWGSLVDGC